MFGIPAMRKLSTEITSWNNEECFKHLVTYATTPPELKSSYEHSDGMRYAQANVLEYLGKKYRIREWSDTSKMFRTSGDLIIDLCKTAIKQETENCSKFIEQIADIEEKAHCTLTSAAQ